MRQYIIVSFLIIGGMINAQIVDIPDPNFKFILITFPFADLNGDGNYDSNLDTNNDNEIQVSEAEAVIGLNIPPVEIIYSIEGIEAFTNLKNLVITGHVINTFDVSQNLQLEVLSCNSNSIEQIILPKNSNLKELKCRFNQISDLDLSNFIYLESLLCGFNELTNIDISNNLVLKEFGIEVNFISEIDITNHSEIYYLSVADNLLTQLDISHNLNLEYLDAGSNELSELDITNNVNLISIHLYYNNVAELDFSQNLNLEQAILHQNLLTELNFSQNTSLKYLRCTNNLLQSLNIQNGNNHNMIQLYTYSNPDLFCIQVDDEDFENYPFCDIPFNYGWCLNEGVILGEDCENLGIESYKKTTISIYPNPVQNNLFIETTEPIDSYTIYNMEGQIIKNGDSKKINVTHFSSGIYFFQVSINRQIVTKKFVIK